jgi:hypothetical protein
MIISYDSIARHGASRASRQRGLEVAFAGRKFDSPPEGRIVASMAASSSAPKFKPCSLKDGSAWYIETTWPNGEVESIGGFQSESEIDDWIARKSPAWLKGRGK